MSKSIQDWIFGSGPSSAKIMAIGEAPGKLDDEIRKNFTGPAGELLTEFFEKAGISRSQLYLTNVVKLRPPDNDLDRLQEITNENTGAGYTVDDFLPLLNNEIEAVNPNVIVAFGSLACKILTGKEGIKSWRGSILPYAGVNRSIKVIPTIHPAALMYGNGPAKAGEAMFSWKQKCHIQFDVLKAVRHSYFPEFRHQPKSIDVIKNPYQLEQFFQMYKDYERVYVDAEVFKSHLVCIGFAFTRYHGCSVSLVNLQNNLNHSGTTLHELVEIYKIIADKLADEKLKKSGQNFKGDKLYWIETAGFELNGFDGHDGMFLSHTLSPELPKSLAFQQSIFTDEPFHKNEGKEFNPYKDNVDDLLRYNAKDCIVNCEVMEEMEKDLDEFGLRQFYQDFVLDLYPIYESMERNGWRIDLARREELRINYEELLGVENARAESLITELGITNDKGLPYFNYNSPKKVAELIYVKMRCPLRKDTADITLTALMNNAVKDSRKRSIINSVLDRRSINKVKSTYIEAQVDPDERIRWSVNQVGTETGRTSSSTIGIPQRNETWGVPIQTIPRPGELSSEILKARVDALTTKEEKKAEWNKYNVRSMFIPDPGKILAEVDQSQAEARIVALLANDLDLLALFDVLDVHKLTASFVYNLSGSWAGSDLIKAALKGEKFDFLSLVSEEQRQVGKSARHGFGYDLSETGLSIKMKISLYRAKQAYLKLSEMSPNIKGVFHEDIQAALADNGRILITPFGRRREFFNKWGNELFREAYAHIPQSTIGDNTKRVMRLVKKVHKIDWIDILEEGHDSFIAQIEEKRMKQFHDELKPLWEQPIDFSRCSLKREPIIIPVEFKFGENWGEMKKVKF